ncbi:MAG: molecular chaperone DnaJ [Candidatus Woesearchaeota archaeon]
MAKDYYNTLGVGKNSSKEEIKKAYKNLAKKYHPDVNKEANATDKFKEVNEAASVLLDDKKKQQYDQFGTTDSNMGQGFGGFEGFEQGFGGFEFDLGDMFGDIFGRSRKRSRSRGVRGNDLEYGLEISLEDAAFGSSVNLDLPRMETCSKCNGTGAKSSDDIVNCPACNGSGAIRRDMRTPFGTFSQTSTCSECGGEGKTIRRECPECGGNGRVRKVRKIEVKIPAGIDQGSSLRVSGEGEAGVNGGPNGDLYVTITLKKHKIFSRKGLDISMEMPITFAQAVFGASVEVPTLKGKADLKIPAGTQCNTIFKMKEHGIPSLDGYSIGSENVKVIVDVPEKLSAKQKELLKEFDKTLDKKKGFFESVFS